MAKKVNPPEIITLSSDSEAESENLLYGLDPTLLRAMLEPPPPNPLSSLVEQGRDGRVLDWLQDVNHVRSHSDNEQEVKNGSSCVAADNNLDRSNHEPPITSVGQESNQKPSRNKRQRSSSSDNDGTVPDNLDWSNATKPGPSSSSVDANFRHSTYGQLSYNKLEHGNRVLLLNWLNDVTKNAHKHTKRELLPKLEELSKNANVGQYDIEKKIVIQYTSLPLSNRKDAIKGFYMFNGTTNLKLASYHLKNFKKRAITEQYYATRSDPTNDAYHQKQLMNASAAEEYPELEGVYICGLFAPELLNNTSPADVIISLDRIPSPLDRSKPNYEVYPGISNGGCKGYTCMRISHLSNTDNSKSKIYSRTKGAPDGQKKCCVQIMYRMCDSKYTRKVAEAFRIRFGEEFNKKHNINCYIFSEEEAPLPWDLILKVKDYVQNDVPMFKFVDPGDRSQLPLA